MFRLVSPDGTGMTPTGVIGLASFAACIPSDPGDPMFVNSEFISSSAVQIGTGTAMVTEDRLEISHPNNDNGNIQNTVVFASGNEFGDGNNPIGDPFVSVGQTVDGANTTTTYGHDT